MIRITITKVLDDEWATKEEFAQMSDTDIHELCWEDIGHVLEDSDWKIERL